MSLRDRIVISLGNFVHAEPVDYMAAIFTFFAVVMVGVWL